MNDYNELERLVAMIEAIRRMSGELAVVRTLAKRTLDVDRTADPYASIIDNEHSDVSVSSRLEQWEKAAVKRRREVLNAIHRNAGTEPEDMPNIRP